MYKSTVIINCNFYVQELIFILFNYYKLIWYELYLHYDSISNTWKYHSNFIKSKVQRCGMLYLTHKGKELVAHGFPEAQSNYSMGPKFGLRNIYIFFSSFKCFLSLNLLNTGICICYQRNIEKFTLSFTLG